RERQVRAITRHTDPSWPYWFTTAEAVVVGRICDVHNALAAYKPTHPCLGAEMDWLPKQLYDRHWHAAHSDDLVEVISFVYRQSAKRGFAKAKRLIERRVKHGAEIAGRAVDDLQYLGGRGLLLQCLVD